MQGQILGIPQSKYDYEFMVATKTENGNFQFHSNHEHYDDAEKSAKEIGGIIIHNVKVAHKQLKKSN